MKRTVPEISDTSQGAAAEMSDEFAHKGAADYSDTVTLQDRIQQRLNELGLSAREASILAGLSHSYVYDLLKSGKQNPRADNLRALARVLKTTPEWLLERRGGVGLAGVPILFVVGARGILMPAMEEVRFADALNSADDVAGAAEIGPDAALSQYRVGSWLYYGRPMADPAPLIGEECIVTLPTGVTALRRVFPGQEAGRYTLSGEGGAVELNAEIESVAEIVWIKRASRRA